MGTPTLILPHRRSPESTGGSRRPLGRGDAGSLPGDARVRERVEKNFLIASGANSG